MKISLLIFCLLTASAFAQTGTPIRQLRGAASTAAWTSATSQDTAVTISVGNFSNVALSFSPSGSITAGSLNFEASDDSGSTYYSILVCRLDAYSCESTFSLNAATKQAWTVSVAGYTNFRVRLNPAITGAGTANLRLVGQAGPVTQRVIAGLASGTNVIGALSANQSTNIAQINGVTPLMGNGATGTGSHRVTLANDSSAIAGKGEGATGSAVPSGALYVAANSTGNLTGLVACDNRVVYDASTSGNTELVALTSSQIIRVCGYVIFASGTVNVRLVYGTGTACATGETSVTPAFQLTAQTGVADNSPFYRGMATAASNALCIETSAGVAVQAVVYYTKY